MSEPLFNIHDTLLFATAFQCFLFVLLIMFAKDDHHISDFFLVGFFIAQIAITAHILINFGEAFRFVVLEESPWLFRFFDIAYWLEGPLLLWYTRAMLYKEFELRSKDLYYLLPTLGYALFILFTFHSLTVAEQIKTLEESRLVVTITTERSIDALRECIRVAFAVLCLIDIRQAQLQIRDRYSSIERIDFTWLSALVIAFLVLRVWILLVVSASLIQPDLGFSLFNLLGLVGNYGTFAMISYLIFFGLTRSKIFAADTKPGNQNDHSILEIDPALTKKIQIHMTENKPYLYHFLSLEQLATQLEMHPRALSLTIKQHFKTNFYEFVNSYRIEEAKRMLSDPKLKTKTMVDILGECGFNSKATYNTFFKKLVGCTPTQYRNTKLKSIGD